MGENSEWTLLDEGETIGAKRLIRTAAVRADQLRITVDTNKNDAVPMISEVGVYKASEDFERTGTAPIGMDVIDIEDTDVSDGAGFAFTNGTWIAESGTNFINGTNRYANRRCVTDPDVPRIQGLPAWYERSKSRNSKHFDRWR